MKRGIGAGLLLAVLAACSGTDGEVGPAGPRGPTGPTGPAGSPGATAISNRWCSAISSGLMFEYQVVDFSTGDVWVACAISDVGSEYETTHYYRSGQAGTIAAVCYLGYDVDTFTGGYWEFRDDSPGPRALYRDTGSAADGAIVSFAPGSCI